MVDLEVTDHAVSRMRSRGGWQELDDQTVADRLIGTVRTEWPNRVVILDGGYDRMLVPVNQGIWAVLRQSLRRGNMWAVLTVITEEMRSESFRTGRYRVAGDPDTAGT